MTGTQHLLSLDILCIVIWSLTLLVVWSCRKLAEVLAELTAAIAHRILMHSAMQVKYEPLNTTAQAKQGKHITAGLGLEFALGLGLRLELGKG